MEAGRKIRFPPCHCRAHAGMRAHFLPEGIAFIEMPTPTQTPSLKKKKNTPNHYRDSITRQATFTADHNAHAMGHSDRHEEPVIEQNRSFSEALLGCHGNVTVEDTDKTQPCIHFYCSFVWFLSL